MSERLWNLLQRNLARDSLSGRDAFCSPLPVLTMPNPSSQQEGAILSGLRIVLKSTAEHTKLPKAFFESLLDSDDWSLVIKLHALVETALNNLITVSIGDNRLLEIVMRLDTSDKQRGKMAFIKALDLLPVEARAFVHKLSELRNDLVHNISSFDFSLEKWIREMSQPDLTNFTKSLNFDVDGKHDFWYSKDKDKFRNLPASDLKGIVTLACLFILHVAIDKEFQKVKEPLERERKRLAGLSQSYEAGLRQGGSLSNPTEL